MQWIYSSGILLLLLLFLVLAVKTMHVLYCYCYCYCYRYRYRYCYFIFIFIVIVIIIIFIFLVLPVKIMYSLHFEITKIYILRLCTWMRATTEVISKDEMWIPLSTLERNKSPYSISYLPLAFQEMTASAMDRIDV